MRKILWGLAAGSPAFRGKQRLFQLIARPSGPSGTVVCREGAMYRLHGHDLNEWYVATQKWHSSDISECLDGLADGPSAGGAAVLWDIGANIGAVTIPFLCRHPSAQAVCFEPSPEVAGRLIGNLDLNPALRARTRVVTAPLSDRDGPIEFFVSSEGFNSGVGGLGLSHNRVARPINALGVTGDSAVATWCLPRPTIVKIDVEGFELEVLRGMRELLCQHRPAVLFEHSLYRIRERQEHPVTAVCDLLRSLHYEIYDLRRSGPISDTTLAHDCDLLALHR